MKLRSDDLEGSLAKYATQSMDPQRRLAERNQPGRADFMKIDVSKANDLQLDWLFLAATRCPRSKLKEFTANEDGQWVRQGETIYSEGQVFMPTANWNLIGPYIRQDKISLTDAPPSIGTGWCAAKRQSRTGSEPVFHFGETPETALIRCVVVDRLGETVEIPDELSTEEMSFLRERFTG